MCEETDDDDFNPFFVWDEEDMRVRVGECDYYERDLPEGLTKDMIAKVENWQQACMRDFLTKVRDEYVGTPQIPTRCIYEGVNINLSDNTYIEVTVGYNNAITAGIKTVFTNETWESFHAVNRAIFNALEYKDTPIHLNEIPYV